MSHRGLRALIIVAVVLAVGALVVVATDRPEPEPELAGGTCRLSAEVILVAQAVPSAGYLPCMREGLDGWVLRSVDHQAGRSEALIATEELEGATWSIELTAACDGATGTEQPGAQPEVTVIAAAPAELDSGAEQYETWQRFPGGCVHSTVEVPVRFATDEILAETADALVLVPRAEVADGVFAETDGRLTLDPEPTE